MGRLAMNESEFERLASETLARIEAAVEVAMEVAGVDVDLQMKPGGILEMEFEDGSKLLVNRQGAAQEIWVAARSGVFHFFYDGSHWLDTRAGGELFNSLSELVGVQSGSTANLAAR